jgi:hypothetical protein
MVGAGLAKTGFNLVSFGWRGVDEVVANSFAQASGLAGAELEDRIVHFVEAGREPRFTGGWTQRFSTEEDVKSGAIGYADAIVLIGGAGWSRDFTVRALEAGIFVLPLAATSTSNEFAAREILDLCHKSGIYQRRGLNPAAVGALAQPIASAAEAVVNLLRSFFEQNPQLKTKPERSTARITGLRASQRERLISLLNDGPKLARLLSRAVLLERSFLPWLETLDGSRFLEESRMLGVKSLVDLLELDERLEKEFPEFKPNPLWEAWFIHYHAEGLRKKLEAALPRGEDIPEASKPGVSAERWAKRVEELNKARRLQNPPPVESRIPAAKSRKKK